MDVILIDEALDVGNQLAQAAKGSATNCLLGDEAKPAFDLVEPTRVGSARRVDRPLDLSTSLGLFRVPKDLGQGDDPNLLNQQE